MGACVCCWGALALSAQQATPEATLENVRYVPGGQARQVLDVYLPEAEPPYPVVVMFPGSGAGKADANMIDVAAHLVEQGYAAVSVDYRQRLPEALDDATCALAWVAANADTYGFDAGRLATFGVSLGGQLAATLATGDEPELFLEHCPNRLPNRARVKGVIAFAGALGEPDTDLALPSARAFYQTFSAYKLSIIVNSLDRLVRTPPDEWRTSRALTADARTIAQWLPLYWLDAGDPPFLLIHGLSDAVIPPAASERFAERLADAGVDVELVLLPGAEHIFPLTPDVTAALDLFLESAFADDT